MNSRPWPEALALIPLINPGALTLPEWTQNWYTVNNLIKEFNDNRTRNPQERRRRDRRPNPTDPWDGEGGGTEALPYDGVSPDHDDVPYVITNGVLLVWPGATLVVGDAAGDPILTLTRATRTVAPYRLILPVWS